MTEKYEIISRKEYKVLPHNGYVDVKQYTLVKCGKKKFVIVRFVNRLAALVDSISFTVEQKDSNGNPIEGFEREQSLYVGLGAGVAFEKEFIVDPKCANVSISVLKVKSCGKEYTLKDGQVVTTQPEEIGSDIPSEFLIPPSQRNRNPFGKLLLVSLTSLIVLLAINILIALLSLPK